MLMAAIALHNLFFRISFSLYFQFAICTGYFISPLPSLSIYSHIYFACHFYVVFHFFALLYLFLSPSFCTIFMFLRSHLLLQLSTSLVQILIFVVVTVFFFFFFSFNLYLIIAVSHFVLPLLPLLLNKGSFHLMTWNWFCCCCIPQTLRPRKLSVRANSSPLPPPHIERTQRVAGSSATNTHTHSHIHINMDTGIRTRLP